MFVGRENETKKIEEELSKPSAFIILYGMRGVGKTALLHHVLCRGTDPTIFFEPGKGTLKHNAHAFSKAVKKAGIDIEESDDFPDIFYALNDQDKTFNIVIDEYPYLKFSENSDYVDSVFQNIVDMALKNVRLFLSGSEIGMMRDLNNPGNPLFGRCTLTLELKAMDYKEASAFYPNKSPYDKAAFYSVFGGSPYVNGNLNPNASLKENIERLFLSTDGVADIYVEKLLMTGDPKARAEVEPLLAELRNGKAKYGELKNALCIDYDYRLTDILTAACSLELVSKVYPINKEGNAKRSYYELMDNALRFFYTFIYPNKHARLDKTPSNFYKTIIEPDLTEFISHRFEGLCQEYFRRKMKEEKYEDALYVGTYYYDDPRLKESGEFDVAIKREPLKNMYCYDIYEAKYLAHPMWTKSVTTELEHIRRIKDLPIQNVGFISICGFDDDCAEVFNGPLIDGEELYR